jgi:uncharacterized HAD superfamily protein
MSRLRIVVDMDGVLADWNGAFHQLLRDRGATLRRFEDDLNPQLWDWPQTYGATLQEEASAWEYINSHKNWWGTLESHADMGPLAWETLNGLCWDEEVYFVTQRERATGATRNWLEGRITADAEFEVISTSKRKSAVLIGLEPDLIIEDRLKTLQSYRDAARSLALTSCELLLVDRPYNRVPVTAYPRQMDGITRVGATPAALLWAQSLPLARKA